MFSVEEPDAKNVYTEIENSLKGFASADLTQQRGRTDCNYEWADDIDVLNVLHGANDWPVSLFIHIFGIIIDLLSIQLKSPSVCFPTSE